MKHEEVRDVFHDALGETPPLPRNDTDDIISAGRRVVGRRRAWRTSGAVAGITAVVALIGFALQQGGDARPLNDAASGPSASAKPSGSDWYTPGTADPDRRYQRALKGVLDQRFPGQNLVERPLVGLPEDLPKTELLEFAESGPQSIVTEVIVHFPTGDPTWLMVNVESMYQHDGSDEDYLREIARCGDRPYDTCSSATGPNGELIVWRGGVDSGNGEDVKNVAVVLRADRTVVRVKATVFTPDETSMSVGDGTSTLPQVTVDDVKAIALALPQAPLTD